MKGGQAAVLRARFSTVHTPEFLGRGYPNPKGESVAHRRDPLILKQGHAQVLGISTQDVNGCSTQRLGLTFSQKLRFSLH